MKIKNIIICIITLIISLIVSLVIPITIRRGINLEKYYYHSTFGPFDNLTLVCSDENATDEIKENAQAVYTELVGIVKQQHKEFYNMTSIMGIIIGVVLLILGIIMLKSSKLKGASISLIISGIITIATYLFLNNVYPLFSSNGQFTKDEKDYINSIQK